MKEFPSATLYLQCIAIGDALDLVMDLSQLIKHSPRRAALFELVQSQLSTITLKPFYPIKRTVHAAAIGFVNYTLCEALLEIYTSILAQKVNTL